jgi:hypothetical protein
MTSAPPPAPCVSPGRVRPLDQLTARHLHDWLQDRRCRWPATANPYLLINQATSGGVQPVSRSYIQATLGRGGVTAQDLRADRFLGEAEASAGDPLRLAHLFEISDPTAIRYCAELDQIIPARTDAPGDSVNPA